MDLQSLEKVSKQSMKFDCEKRTHVQMLQTQLGLISRTFLTNETKKVGSLSESNGLKGWFDAFSDGDLDSRSLVTFCRTSCRQGIDGSKDGDDVGFQRFR